MVLLADKLISNAAYIPGKGSLAADESTGKLVSVWPASM